MRPGCAEYMQQINRMYGVADGNCVFFLPKTSNKRRIYPFTAEFKLTKGVPK